MIKIGDEGTFCKIISENDVIEFSNITGDKNPLHLDEVYAKNTIFHEKIAHGMIGAGIISAAIAMIMPGEGTIYKKQTLDFRKPVKIGDEITAKIKVLGIENKRNQTAKLETICINQKQEVVITGEAEVILP